MELWSLDFKKLGLNGFVENVDRIIRQLKTLNENINNNYITSEIESKLPQYLMSEIIKIKVIKDNIIYF